MDEADDLARRFFGLWAEYLTTVLSDPNTAERLQHWLVLAGAAPTPGSREPAFNWPRPAPDAAAAAGASGERDAALAELARRVDELAERVAALEGRRRTTRRTRSRNSAGRS